MDPLVMPDWTEARARWRELTQSGTLFSTLVEMANADAVSPAVQHLERWLDYFEYLENASEQAKGRRQWKIARALVACAQVARIDPLQPDSPAQLAEVLAAFQWAVEGKTASLKPDVELIAAAIDAQRTDNAYLWDECVRRRLRGLSWELPLSVEWAWDAISRFKGMPSKSLDSVSITVLLEWADKGVTAKLTLERLTGVGDGSLFADPETMSFIHCDQAFWDGVRHADTYVRNELRLWPAVKGQPNNVRWRLTLNRQELEPLREIEGGSAGAAFALALAKLAAQVNSV
jgi:hypothetical protein